MQNAGNRQKIEEKIFLAEFSSPAGKIIIISDEKKLKAVKFFTLPGIYSKVEILRRQTEPIKKTVQFFEDYFSAKVGQVSRYKIDFDFSFFTAKQAGVYKSLLNIPFGKTITYGELAEKSGFSNAARFVGTTMARNLFPVIIPCHRVVRSDGAIGEYSGGKGIKEFLLRHEGSLPRDGGRRL